MKKITTFIKQNWLLCIIILQPILDIISYFQEEMFGKSYSWIARIIILLLIGCITFFKSKNKLKLILKISPFFCFFILHFLNLFYTNRLNVINDLKYFILVFQMPILTILLIDYLKDKKEHVKAIKKGMVINYIVIAFSILISFITNTYETTYDIGGITGWFSSANTASMILCALAPWTLHYFFKKGNDLHYILISIATMVLLYFNATKACYATLVASFFVVIVFEFLSYKKKKVNIILPVIFFMLSLGLYNVSLTAVRQKNVDKTVDEDSKIISELIDFNSIDISNDEDVLNVLNASYIYRDLIEIHGEKKVIDIMRNHLSAEALSNNRYRKLINAKIEYKNTNLITKFLGFGYNTVAKNNLDLENDFSAIYYYYGFVGFGIYVAFICYFILKMLKLFIKNPAIIINTEFVILAFLIALLVFGGEYSGAFFRKPNANIYFSLLLSILYFNIYINDNKNIKLKNKKVTFLLLHLGYGGIETSTINTANALSNDYEVEIVSFYNLKHNQEKFVKNNIRIKYLYNGGPNKDEFISAVKKINIFKILYEGFKSVSILIKRKWYMVNYIYNCDAKNVVSTRYDYSVLLSKYGNKNAIKFAQEHHHHNNNKKYINILSTKYKNINYLCALTKGLKNDYKKFLKENNYTKIIYLPNMIIDNNTEKSDLKSKNIISVGRLHKGKRIDELINIFSKIKNKKSKLYIIGDGEEKDRLKQLIYDKKLENRVIMLGYLDKEQQKDYYLDSCVFAMTSESEGLPMVLLEAMQYGIPCIAFKTDTGVADIISDNNNGFIIKNRNYIKYQEKLDEILNDNVLRKKMGASAMKTVSEFSSSEVLKIWNKLLK